MLAYLNYRGLTIVGRAAMVMTVFIIIPFIILGVLAVPQIEPSNWVVQDWSALKWGPFLNVMFW